MEKPLYIRIYLTLTDLTRLQWPTPTLWQSKSCIPLSHRENGLFLCTIKVQHWGDLPSALYTFQSSPPIHSHNRLFPICGADNPRTKPCTGTQTAKPICYPCQDQELRVIGAYNSIWGSVVYEGGSLRLDTSDDDRRDKQPGARHLFAKSPLVIPPRYSE